MKNNTQQGHYKNIYQKLNSRQQENYLNANLIGNIDNKIYSQTIILHSPNFSVNNTYISGVTNGLNTNSLWNPRVNSALDSYPSTQKHANKPNNP